MAETWILAVVNLGGAVTVTALFLWFSMKREERADLVAKELMARMEAMEEASNSHNATIAREFAASVGRMFEAINGLAQRSLESAASHASALQELQTTVEHLRGDVQQITRPRR